ncbi:MAG: hypothetical protein V5A23_02845 [Halobacteriales archaeon]
MTPVALAGIAPAPSGAIAPGTVPTGGGALAVLGTIVVTALFYAATLHLAAVFFLGDVPLRKALAVGAAVAVASLVAGRWGPAVSLPATLAADAAAVLLVYDRGARAAAALVALHFAFATILGVALVNLLGVL